MAAAKVGPTGKAIGIDMTDEMLALANANAAQVGLTNVAFYKATIDKLPLPDASVDCVISNCVINLAADKPAVFREIARVLKPGGRLAVSDIALKQPLPAEIGNDLMAYVGCIAGAIPIDSYLLGLVGFKAVRAGEDAHGRQADHRRRPGRRPDQPSTTLANDALRRILGARARSTGSAPSLAATGGSATARCPRYERHCTRVFEVTTAHELLTATRALVASR